MAPLIEDKTFDNVYDPAGQVIEDLELRRWAFVGGGLGLRGDVRHRTLVRRVTLQDCTVAGAGIGPALLEDITVQGLRTNGLLHVWGAAFKHVTLRGRIGRILITDLTKPQLRTSPEQRAFSEANAKFYKEIDWALDISEAEAEELQLEGIPARLVRRDPATQIVVTRQAAQIGAWRKLERSALTMGIEDMLDVGYPDMVLVAAKRSRHFQESLNTIQRLREIGVAEPD